MDISHDRLLASLHAYLHGGCIPDNGQLDAIGRGLEESLSFRDAIILAAVRPDAIDPVFMSRCACAPHDTEVASRMGVLLTEAFEHGKGFDRTILRRLDELLVVIGARPDGVRNAQVAAVRAYLAWWVGGDAGGLALQALVLDGDCTLAVIVLTAVSHGLYPFTGR